MENAIIEKNEGGSGSFLFGLGFILTGLAAFLLQVIGYLKYGDWEGCSVVSCWLPIVNFEHIYYLDWIGLYNIIDFFSAPFLFIGLGLLMVIGSLDN